MGTFFKLKPVELKLNWSVVALFLLPALAWAALLHSRPLVMDLKCQNHPELCQPAGVPAYDRMAIRAESPQADRLSFITQDFSAVLALGITLGWILTLARKQRITSKQAFVAVLSDWMILIQAVVWNGLTNESVRLLIQRPRPFVYSNPIGLGGDPAHYTSFYSGHTSFSAVVGSAMLFLLFGRKAPRALLLTTGWAALTLVFFTGLFRVLSGRHFPTDVLVGALAGSLIGFVVTQVYRARAY